jgi:DNA-directed RNA polymerase subunit RPC12/RpoP
MQKPKFNGTRTVDVAKCCWCGETFNGDEAINYDISNGEQIVECPHCNGRLAIFPSVEYQVHPVDEDGEVI